MAVRRWHMAHWREVRAPGSSRTIRSTKRVWGYGGMELR